jgi:hypothetical protein
MAATAALLASLGGCAIATTGKFEAKLNNWVGSDESSLIQSWGPPTQSYETRDGRVLHTWHLQGETAIVPLSTGGAVAIDQSCNITFTLSPTGRVEHWRYRGHGCKST